MEQENNKRELVYSGNFSDDEIAASWQIIRGSGKWQWKYHYGRRDEDIFFRFDSKVYPAEMPSRTLTPEVKEADNTLADSVVSPPIHLLPGIKYELDYELRLFGISHPAETSLMLWFEEEGSSTSSPVGIILLQRRKWPLDGFQWPVGNVSFSVNKEGYYRFALKACNEVPVNFYWMSISRKV